MSLDAGSRLGPYDVQALLGAGRMGDVNHPNIAAMYRLEDVPVDDGPHVRAFIMELAEGETLAGRIARGARPGLRSRLGAN